MQQNAVYICHHNRPRIALHKLQQTRLHVITYSMALAEQAHSHDQHACLTASTFMFTGMYCALQFVGQMEGQVTADVPCSTWVAWKGK